MAVDIVKLAQESPTAAAFEAGIVGSLQREVGFDAALFSLVGAEPFGTVVGLDEKTRARLIARGSTYAAELLPVKRAALAARGVAVDTEVCSARYVENACYYREIAATIGGRHSLLAFIPWRGRVVAGIMLGRSGSTFTRREVELLEGLLPTLGVARAAFGLPWRPAPLPVPRETGLARWLGSKSSRVLASATTESALLTVRDRAGFREMRASNGASELVWTRSSLTDPRKSGWPYVELLHLAATLAEERRSALFIGCGGGVGLCQFASRYPGIALDVVEREPAVVELSRAWFGLDAIPHTTVHVAEGASFIRRAAASSWDIVVLDAYDAAECSSELLEREFLLAVRRALQPGGALACNIIGALGGQGPLADFVVAARAVFADVRLVPVVHPDETYSPDSLRNVVVIATRD